MKLTIEQVLQQGVTVHKEGKLQEAERLYRTILQSQPAHPDANHNLGVLAVSVNKVVAALPLFKTALEANPKIEQFWLSYIDALIKENQFDNANQVIQQAKKQGLARKKFNSLEARLVVISQTENSNSSSPTPQQLNNLLECYQTGRYSDAEKLAISLTQQFPEHQFGWKVLGAVVRHLGRKSEALKANQKAVALSPQDAEAHNNLGLSLEESGRLEEAEASLGRAIALQPIFAEAYYNLGNTLKQLYRLEEAGASYTQAIAFKPDYAEAHYNLGITLQDLGRLEEAEASYKLAIAFKPDYAEAHSNLGGTLKQLGTLDEAVASFTQAIAFKPDFAEAHYNLGVTLKELGRLGEAEVSYKQAIALHPDYSIAKHLLAALNGETTATAPRDYVEGLFDTYAAKFDSSLVDVLEYKTPKVIADMIIEDSEFNLLGSMVDLGCGTGLFGMEIKQVCENLEGVDLSEKMLDKANKKNIYNKLIKQDIVDYLSNASLNFNYFVSTDVFIYIGDLSDVFRLIKSRNKKNGKLAFSTEDYDGDGFFLEQSGRYSHSKKYIEGLCAKFGYQLRHFETHTLRKENDQYIIGGLYLLDF